MQHAVFGGCMKLISGLKIENFRSLRNVDISGLGSFTSIAGLNNAGKSNVLRALNAFFTGQTEPGKSLEVDEDYYRPDQSRKQKKKIRVSVRFDLPALFKFRSGLEPVEKLLSGRKFEIAKEWTRDVQAPDYLLNGSMVSALVDRQRIDQFLQMINFRYVPNRVLPLDVIREQHQALRDVLVRRIGRKLKAQDKAFEAIRSTSEELIASVSRRFQEAVPDGGGVRLATPSSWSEIAFAFGYRMSQGDIEIEDIAQGSGIQSLLMFETLHLIDQDYYQQFGWRQAAVWAVEEPESSLHMALEAKLASFLRQMTHREENRLQILSTTHSDLMIQYSDKTVMAAVHSDSRGKAMTRLELALSPRAALELSSQLGVARWSHTILHYPLDPVLIVEGKHDRVFFDRAFEVLGCRRKPRVVDLSILHGGSKTGGDGDVVNYVTYAENEIRTRAQDAPVVVVFDWDSRGKATKLSGRFREGDPFSAIGWPDDALNPKIPSSVKGIERALSDRLVEIAIKQDAEIHLARNGKSWVFDVGTMPSTKAILSKIVAEHMELEDLAGCQGFLEEVISLCACGNS